MKHYRTEGSLGSILGIQINRTINPGTMRDAKPILVIRKFR